MARETVTVITDDIDGTPEAQTVLFGFDGKQYEVDLSEKNRKRLADALDPFIERARRTGSASSASRSRSAASSRTQNLGEVRQWAKSNGHSVSERGRIPASVLDAYAAAH